MSIETGNFLPLCVSSLCSIKRDFFYTQRVCRCYVRQPLEAPMSRRWKRMAHPRATTTNSIDGIVSPNEKMIQLFLIGFVALHFVFSFRFHQRQIRERRIELVLGGERERERWHKTITSRTIETETSSEMTADQEATRGVPARPC